MKANEAAFPVAAMCRVLDLSPSGYYGWLKRPPSARPRRDAELKDQIMAIWSDNGEIYGCPRIHAVLLGQGERLGPEASGAPDEGFGHSGRDAEALQDGDDEEGREGPACAGLGRPGFLGRRPRPAVGCRHHLRAPHGPAGCTSRSSSMPGAAALSAGRWRRTCGPNWSRTRWRWRSRADSRGGWSFIIRTVSV